MPSAIQFVKTHGLGNDFILVDCVSIPQDADRVMQLAECLCDRHTGIGADGVLVVLPSTVADYRMRIINSDGSEAEMCGNGIRCFARYLYDHKLSTRVTVSIETLAGIIRPEIVLADQAVRAVRVDMGAPRLERGDIPMLGIAASRVINEPLALGAMTYRVTAVSMGNPHAIIFVDDVETAPVEHVGPQIETHPIFPRKTNVEFVQVVSPTFLRMRVWERGAGITQACGTGACATLVAAVLTGQAERTAVVELPGGPLEITWDAADDHVYMTGPATEVFHGTISL
jgi:diaminopimelate epimerase